MGYDGFLQLILEANVDILQIQVMVVFTTLMTQLNEYPYGLQQIVGVSESHYQKRNHNNEGLTSFTGKTSTSYPVMECE